MNNSSHVVLVLLLFAQSNLAFGDIGHCSFKQKAPRIDEWFEACVPAGEKSECRELKFDKYVGDVDFGVGDCRLDGLVGICSTRKGDMYLYQGSDDLLQKGCEMMNGSWRIDLVEKFLTEKAAPEKGL